MVEQAITKEKAPADAHGGKPVERRVRKAAKRSRRKMLRTAIWTRRMKVYQAAQGSRVLHLQGWSRSVIEDC